MNRQNYPSTSGMIGKIVACLSVIAITCVSCNLEPESLVSYDMSGTLIQLRGVPSGSCPAGTRDDGNIDVKKPYFLAENEFTNRMAVNVLQWALDNDRISIDPGLHNTVDKTSVRFGARILINLESTHSQLEYSEGRFASGPGLDDYPLIEVSWFGAVMLCNWMTEIVDRHSKNIVYSGMDEDWNDDETLIDVKKSGFRLPTVSEWELAARYIDGESWLPGDHASGDLGGTCYDRYPTLDGKPQSPYFGDYGWYEGNSGSSGSSGISPPSGTHLVGTAGSSSSTPLSGLSNFLGLYDMSGNVWEWCSDDYHHMRLIKGGCWWMTRAYMRVGHWEHFRPTYEGTLVGFRPARSITSKQLPIR